MLSQQVGVLPASAVLVGAFMFSSIRPLVMLLEDLGVRWEDIMRLQSDAVADTETIHESSEHFRKIPEHHSLGRSYHLSRTLKRIEGLGLVFNAPKNDSASGFDTQFLYQVRQVAKNDVLRDIKHHARIPVPNSYLLVGVADEGPAYISAGFDNVFTWPENNIFGVLFTGHHYPSRLRG
jgi:RNA-dependent RNA polymerase